MNRKLTLGVLAGASALILGSCSTARYYWQGIAGELDLLDRAQPIPSVVESTSDAALKQKLEHTIEIREFASKELGLPDNGSYRRYTALDRPYVLWNVFATPPLSLEPRQWCFPVAGCVNYRGYFAEAAAHAEASRLSATGEDVYVGGVPAYSTLGYFDDPVLSTIIRYPEPEVARLIFHELAHQIAYAKDDTVFNESFAVTVEEVGVERWLAKRDDPKLTAQFEWAQRQREAFLDLVRRTRSRLETLYVSAASDEEKRAGKAAAFAAMRAEYEAQNAASGGHGGFDAWFSRGANNAAIVAVGLYTEKVPQFKALLDAEGGDLPRFYARVKQLSAMSKVQRELALAAVASGKGLAAAFPR
ncbi:MAG TPA: aminopeptidase [Casimicrobiaceae bacterium]|jgi:predicted aminopeptidase|nr:aminopeptidase [Casimicrobiaceae bacterium]